MSDETLRELLVRLHERLTSSNSLSPEARDLLATAMRDIDGALGKGPTDTYVGLDPSDVPTAVDDPSTAAPRIEALAVHFEAEHPSIAQLLRQIGALLAQAGI
jgi:hypothetical protein